MAGATVIVPTHNGRDRVLRLLETLDTTADDAQTVVVDNASTDGTGDAVRARFPAVRLLRSEKNLGFGAAVNRAVRLADGGTLVLVNDDCVCEPGFVPALVDALEPREGVVMAAGVLLAGEDPGVVENAGLDVDATLLAYDHLGGADLSVLDRDVRPPFAACGGAAAYDADAFRELGGFDEALFAYGEDLDLALRLSVAGARCALARRARAVHAHSATLGHGSREKTYLVGFSRGYLLRKWSVLRRQPLPALAREAGAVAVQVAADRTLAGARGRAAGWRAAARGPTEPYPDAVARAALAHPPRLGSLLARRRRLRRRDAAGVRSGR